MSLLKQHSIPVIDVGISKDDPTVLLSKLRDALSSADVLVTSGGVSMGERDILRPVLQSDFEAEIHFAQVSRKHLFRITFYTLAATTWCTLISLSLPPAKYFYQHYAKNTPTTIYQQTTPPLHHTYIIKSA